MYIFILAVQLLPSGQNRCGASLDLAFQRSWELLGYSSLTVTSLETGAAQGHPHIPGRASPLHWCHRFSPLRRDMPCSGTPRYHVRTPYLLQPRSNRGLERKKQSPPK